MLKKLDNVVRRAIFRALFNSLGRGRDAQEILADELRRSKGGSLGVVHNRGDDVLVECGDNLVWCAKSDRLISGGLVKHGHWQRDDFDNAIDLLKSCGRWTGGAFIDVGANIGTQSIYAGLHPDIDRVIAIEPEPRNFDLLTRNIAINGLQRITTTHQFAISEAPGEVHLSVIENKQGMHRVRATATDTTIAVPAQRLDDVLAKDEINLEEIALVWIDVEGHELEVFRSMPSVLDAGVPVYFEYAARHIEGQSRTDLIERLKKTYSAGYLITSEGPKKLDFETLFDTQFGDLLLM